MKIISGYAVSIDARTDVRVEVWPLTEDTVNWINEEVTDHPADWTLIPGLCGWGASTHTLRYRGADHDGGPYHVTLADQATGH